MIKKHIMHDSYKGTLFCRKQMRHGMKVLRSEGYEIYSMHNYKVSLSAFDNKR